MESTREQRKLVDNLKFTAQINGREEDSDRAAVSISCEVADLSGRGLHVMTDATDVPSTPVDITIRIGDSISSYALRGEIRWTRISDERCHIGIELEDNAGLDAWTADFG